MGERDGRASCGTFNQFGTNDAEQITHSLGLYTESDEDSARIPLSNREQEKLAEVPVVVRHLWRLETPDRGAQGEEGARAMNRSTFEPAMYY